MLSAEDGSIRMKTRASQISHANADLAEDGKKHSRSLLVAEIDNHV
jgi:hypothetical protein